MIDHFFDLFAYAVRTTLGFSDGLFSKRIRFSSKS